MCHSAPQHSTYLVDSTRNEAVNVLILSEDLWEGGAEGWGSLHSGKAHLANAVRVLEAKDATRLVHGHTLLHTQDVPIETGTAARTQTESGHK